MGADILVVEDERTLRENLAAFLAREGHHAAMAESGAEAIALLKRRTFAIVVMDVHLGDMDGIALLQDIQSQRGNTAVLMMTADPSLEAAIQAFARGAHGYLRKPFSLQEFGKQVSHLARLLPSQL